MPSGMRVAISCTALTLLAGCAAQSGGAGADADGVNIRCETITPVGSRLGKRLCMTEGEWEAWTQEQQERGDQIRRPGQTPERKPSAGGG